MYQFEWLAGDQVSADMLAKFADLYSQHYGVWGPEGVRPGERIRLTPERVKEWLGDKTHIVWATALGELVGYAITVQSAIENIGDIAWVTQLVVHEEHRDRDVGKRLLFTAWKFTDFFAWGLLSANPYAVRALEKATRRRCIPKRVRQNVNELKKFGAEFIHYVCADSRIVLEDEEARIDSGFFIDHSQLPRMLKSVQRDGNHWTLGELPPGWEWFAFTFRDQDQFNLTSVELEDMLRASDEITKSAYARMLLNSPKQKWASHCESEVDFIQQQFSSISPRSILDFGCGIGRHALELASRGVAVTAVDYVEGFINEAKKTATEKKLVNASFILGDCRKVELNKRFDAAICLYDVVGSYADDLSNRAILVNVAKHLRPGGLVLISVMNLELTVRRAKNWFSLQKEPDRLLALKPSVHMETTGDVFDPEHYMIETSSYLVYRKEQFREGTGLPEEFIVRDKRYYRAEIENDCATAGLNIEWSHFVRAGKWSEALPSNSDSAKEILLLCSKPQIDHRQLSIF
jgi:2-polyprenyl-3-methyl-5-hydroxy-6-metoxy-1,4-benzoquinol methylase/GNAT superfamily N-acetyltransferase